MKKILFLALITLSTMTYSQQNTIQEPVLSGSMTLTIIQTAFN